MPEFIMEDLDLLLPKLNLVPNRLIAKKHFERKQISLSARRSLIPQFNLAMLPKFIPLFNTEPVSPTETITSRTTLLHTPPTTPPPPTSPRPRPQPRSRPATTLDTLPPELLLKIITHLPTSSFLPLIQTSHGLRKFITHHAATITNTKIATLYSTSASILAAGHDASSPWLTPHCSSILAQQNALSAQRWRTCRLCFDPMRMNPPTHSRSQSPSRPESENGSGNQTPSRLQLQKCTHVPYPILELTSPGPLFLLFLERYDWEIRFQYEQMRNRPEVDGNDVEQAEAVVVVEEREEGDIKRELADRVGVYCVKPFLKRLEEVSECIWSRSQTREQEENNEKPEEGNEIANKLKDLTRLKLKKNWIVVKEKAKSLVKGCFGREKKSDRELLFGEVVGGESATMSEKKSSVGSEMERALAWYYGETGVSKCPEGDEDRLGFSLREKRD